MNKILVVALDNLGDVVMATSVIEPLRRYLPGVRIGFWTKSYAARVLENQGLDFAHAADPFWDGAPGRGRGPVRDFLRALAEVRAVRYDTALVLNTEWRRALACRLAAVPRRIGFGQRKSSFFLTEAVAPGAAGHQIDSHRRLLEQALGQAVPGEACLPKLRFSDADRRIGRDWVARQGWKDGTVVIVHPFTGDVFKCWPLPRWRELMRRVGAQTSKVHFAVACAAGEEAVLKPYLADLPMGSASVVVPLDEVRALLSLARAFVGGDSGIGHMAAAADVPVLSLFGPTSPARYEPRGRAAVRVIERNPLAGLDVDTVAAQLLALL